MKKLAIITARGGSKRIPGKNIKPFHGKPLISYSIEAALKSEIFDEIMVSTDSDEISDIAHSFGAKVPFQRSARNSDDYASTMDVLIEVINQYQELGNSFDQMCCLYPTAPFLTAKKIRDSHQLFESGQYHSLVTITEFGFPIQRAFRRLDNQTVQPISAVDFEKRSQDLEPHFHDVGQLYWFDVKKMMQTKNIITEKTVGFFVPPSEAQDIDTLDDWIIAEAKFQVMKSRQE